MPADTLSRWRQCLPWLVLLMWIAEFTHLTVHWVWTSHLAAIVALVVAFSAVGTTGGTPRMTFVVCSFLVVAIATINGQWLAVWAGVQKAALFACFLASLLALGALVRLSSRLESLQQSFDQQPQAARSGVLQVLGLLFAVPLAVGAVGVVAPLLSRQLTQDQRLVDASWAMRGMGMAVLFSPFTVAMGVAIESSVDEMPIGMLMLSGLLMALGLVGFSFFRGQCALPRKLPGAFYSDLLLMFSPVVLLISVNMGFVFGLGYTPMQAAAITLIPGVVLLALLKQKDGLARTVTSVRSSWSRFDGEIAIFVASLCFASAVSSIAEVNEIVAAFAAVTGPTALIILTAVLIVAFAMVGVHMVVTATLFVTVFSPLMQTEWQVVLLALSSLLGWSFGTMAAIGSLAYVAACNILGVSTRKMAIGINLRFMTVSVVLFSLVVVVLSGGGFVN